MRSSCPLFRRKHKLLILFVVILTSSASGEDTHGVHKAFEEAEFLYQKNDFEGAVHIYEELLSKGIVSSSVYYNLGNAYFRSGNIGKTILNYERALRLSPNDKELKHNLSYVRELLQDKIDPSEPPQWIQRVTRLHRLFPLNGLSVAASLFYMLALFFISVSILTPSFRKSLKTTLLPPVVLFLVSLGIGTFKIIELRFSPAIVISDEADVHYGPSQHETKAFVLHAGTKCTIRDVSGEWVLVWLSNDRGGWIHQGGIERI